MLRPAGSPTIDPSDPYPADDLARVASPVRGADGVLASESLVTLTKNSRLQLMAQLFLLAVAGSALAVSFLAGRNAVSISVMLTLAVLAGLAGLAGLVICWAERRQQLQLASASVRDVRIAAAEQVRHGLARDLHDDILQLLGAARMRLAAVTFAGREGQRGGHPGGHPGYGADEVIEMLDGLIQSTRALIHQLKGPEMIGLEKSVCSLCRWIGAAYSISIRLDIDGVTSSPDEACQLTRAGAFRVIQEALSNAARHSGGDEVQVTVAERGNTLVVSVSDNGRGLDPSAPGTGLGLRSMRERVESLGGTFTIASSQAAPTGTYVMAVLPMTRLIRDDTAEAGHAMASQR